MIDYTKEDFTRSGQRYDLILDNVGNPVVIGMQARPEAQGNLRPDRRRRTDEGRWIGPLARPVKALLLSPFVSQKFVMFMADLNQKDLNALGDLMRAGKVTPVIDRHYTLSEVPEAIRYLEQGHARGKVVISVE